jgi:hypothetical protein
LDRITLNWAMLWKSLCEAKMWCIMRSWGTERSFRVSNCDTGINFEQHYSIKAQYNKNRDINWPKFCSDVLMTDWHNIAKCVALLLKMASMDVSSNKNIQMFSVFSLAKVTGFIHWIEWTTTMRIENRNCTNTGETVM